VAGPGTRADRELPDCGPSQLAIDPIERAATLPASWYTDPDFVAFERRAIFERHWHLVGHTDELRDHGDLVVAEAAGRSVIVVRDGDSLRAFHNVCRHRAGPLATENGRCEALVCRYHGWRYGLDGALESTADFGQPEAFDASRIRLRSLAVAAWQGRLFVHLDPRARFPEQAWAAIAERLAPVRLDRYRFDHRRVYATSCNWKAYVDNYLEGFHVPFVHPGLEQQLDYASYRVEVFEHHSLQSSPLDAAPTRRGRAEGEALYFFVYPNIMLNCLPDRLQTNVILPDGPDRCRVVFDYFYADAVDAADRAADRASAHQTQLEDVAICEQVQRNLASGAYGTGRISPRWETALKDFQDRVRRSYGERLAR